MIRIIILIYLLGLFASIEAQNLEEYQAIAVENNPGLKAKYHEFEAALKESAGVSSLPDPQLGFGYFISPVETRVGPQRAKLSLSQRFPWFGTLKSKGEVSALMAEAKYADFIDKKNQLMAKVAQAYYKLYELENVILLQEENLKILYQLKSIVQSKFSQNKSSMADVLRTDLMIEQLKNRIKNSRNRKKPLQADFNQLLNRKLDTDVEIIDRLSITSGDQKALYQRNDSIFQDHPKLKAAAIRANAMEEREKSYQLQGLPSFGLGLDYVFIDERSGVQIEDNGQNAFMPMVSLSIPIFRKKYQAGKEGSGLLRESYLEQEVESRNQLNSNYEMAIYKLTEARNNYQLYEKQIEIADQTLRLLKKDYANGRADFEEVLDLQRLRIEYQILKLSSLSQYHQTKAEIEYWLLGGYEDIGLN